MPKKYLLSYDASLDWHYDRDEDFRKTLAEFLFLQGASALDSCVSSTIVISLPNNGIQSQDLKTNLLNEFGEHFKFVLVVIAKGSNNIPVIRENPSEKIRLNFRGLINRIRNTN